MSKYRSGEVQAHIAMEMGAGDGYAAAMANASSTSYPRLSEMDSDESRSAYTTYFDQRYQQTKQAIRDTKGSDPAKIAVALSDAVSKIGGKSVQEWEATTAIPSWEVADAVASNFNADEIAFERLMATGDALAKVQAQPALYAAIVSFVAQWRGTYAAIRGRQGFTPSTAVAEVRRARSAMNTLSAKVSEVTTAVPPVVTAPPVKPVAPPPPPPAIAAKAKVPGWAVIVALVAFAGGAFAIFRKKTPEPPKQFGMRAGDVR